jgi:CheY-like chemotaxis protein
MPRYATILLIDDDEDSSYLHKRLIENLGVAARVHTCNSGQAALDFIQLNFLKGPEHAGMFPALLFVDIKMPEMDGFEFLKRFEELPEVPKEGIRIFLLTSFNHPADLEEAKKFNIDGIINKPLTGEKMIRLAQSDVRI